MSHHHGEAFKLATYRSDDNTETEQIWNSRDGVTPFVIKLKSGKAARHVDWGNDVYAPDHKPQPGERMFIDLTPERAREIALENARALFNDARPGLDPRSRWATPEAMADDLAVEYLQPGAPDLVEVPAEADEATAPEVSPYDELPCPMPECGEPLFITWVLTAGLTNGSLTDAPPVPGDADAGTWHVECLDGHRPLAPGPIVCPCGRVECTVECDDADVDSSDELRTFRAADLGRLRDLIAQLTEGGQR